MCSIVTHLGWRQHDNRICGWIRLTKHEILLMHAHLHSSRSPRVAVALLLDLWLNPPPPNMRSCWRMHISHFPRVAAVWLLDLWLNRPPPNIGLRWHMCRIVAHLGWRWRDNWICGWIRPHQTWDPVGRSVGACALVAYLRWQRRRGNRICGWIRPQQNMIFCWCMHSMQ